MEFGKRPEERTTAELLETGIIVIDKPAGPTSHQVAAWVARILGRKVGHGGTLDPNVTGVLPVATGVALRALDALHYLPKEYVGVLRFHADVERAQVESLFKEFTGSIFQMPPVRSAVKRERRVRQIYELSLLEQSGRRFLFRVKSEAGTYIRTLCRDIGEAACTGGQMEELRRIASGPFTEQEAVTLQHLEDAHYYHEHGNDAPLRSIIQPMERLLREFPCIILKNSAVDSVCRGANLTVRGIRSITRRISRGDVVSLFTEKGEGVALARALMTSENMENAASGVACDTLRVFMKPGTYPRFQ
jgi:H/ACA ribonucleoprotein complex subunit 4